MIKTAAFLAVIPLAWAATALAGDVSPADPRYRRDVSDDGHQVVEELAGDEPAAGRLKVAGTSPIFGPEPDWQNDIRLAVGGVAVADLDGDTRLDVVLVCYNANAFPPYPDWRNYIYFNTGNELEATPSWVSDDEIHSGDVQVADIDGDTFPDVFVANGGSPMSPASIYFGGPGGPATSPGWTAGDVSWTNAAAIFDVDHDDDLDVVTANQGNSQFDPYRPMRLFLNNAGNLATTPSWESAETSIQGALSVADLDGDGWEDVAVSKWVSFESGVYKNDAGTLQTVPTWTTGDDSADRGVAWGDVDGDDDPDLALGHDPDAQLFANDAGVLSLVWTGNAPSSSPQDFRFCDVDLDGDPDLLETFFSSGVVNLYLNQAGVLDTTPTWSWDGPARGTALGCGDIDGNGMPDLVVGNAGDVSLWVFYNQLVAEIFSDGFESGDLSAWSVSP